MINLDYPEVLDLFKEHLVPGRAESASFLIWYLENYYRLDSLEAVDSVCDQRGDKGVDGIYVNDGDNTIDIFQSRLLQRKERTIGDTALKEFFGTLKQFESRESIGNLITSGGDAHVVRLVKQLDLMNKIETHEMRGFFLSNVEIDENGVNYLKLNPKMYYVGKSGLLKTYISDRRTTPISAVAEFDISGLTSSEYVVDKDTKALIVPIKARELVKLNGIADQSLFAFNVRGPLGRTQVNKDIENSIKDAGKHKLFPLFHNGITIICSRVKDTADKITIENYFVVNGCQSIDALFRNSARLTDELRILTKFVQIEVESALSGMVTAYSNNQNAVKPVDSKANDPIQIRLQNEFEKIYDGQYYFEIKRGERSGRGETIVNEDAGRYMWAFDLKEPWATHRRYQIFEDKHADIFGRPQVNADRIVMCNVIMEAVEDAIPKIKNQLFGKYALSKYFMMYVIRCILESDPVGVEVINKPEIFVREKANRDKFRKCVGKVINDTIVDINAEIEQYGDDFDYRGRLRDETWVKKLASVIVGTYVKLIQRQRLEAFCVEWGK